MTLYPEYPFSHIAAFYLKRVADDVAACVKYHRPANPLLLKAHRYYHMSAGGDAYWREWRATA